MTTRSSLFTCTTVLVAALLGFGSAQAQRSLPHGAALRSGSPVAHTLAAPLTRQQAAHSRLAATARTGTTTIIASDDERGGPPSNDNCANAQALTVNAAGDCPANEVAGDNSQATHDGADPACDVTSTLFQDVWYSFNSGTNSQININITIGTIVDLGVEFIQGTCAGTSIFCDFTATGYTVPVTPGTNYRIRISSNNDFGVGGTFGICLSAVGAPPPNDECVGATIQNLSVPGSVSTSGNNTGATDSEGIGFNTTWEAFTIGSCADVTVDYCGTTPPFGQYFVNLVSDCALTTLYDTTSTSACVDGNGSLLFTGLAAGTYYFPVLQSALATGPYTVNFSAVACGGGTGPVNDLCSSVIPVTLNAGSSATFTGDNTDATAANDALAGSVMDIGGDTTTVWHGFTTTVCTNISVAYCGTPTLPNTYWAVLATSCPADDNLIYFTSGNFTDCADGNATIFFTAVPAGTYYLPVRGEPTTAGPYTVLVSAVACATAPANDDCGSVTPLNVNLTCVFTQGDDNGATQSLPAITCGGFTGLANDDVWYSFVATSPNEVITVDGDDPFDAVVELLTGGCASPATLACSDTSLGGGIEVITMTNLAIGNTYYVRVYDWFGGYPTTTTFNICITGDVGTNVSESANSSFGVHPNPNDGDITLTYRDANSNVVMELFDMTGRIVFTERRSMVAGQTVTLPLAGQLALGTYTLRLSTSNGRSEQRVMVK